jgi:hypothetical protein
LKKGGEEAEKMVGIDERIERDVDYGASVIESISRSLYIIFSDLVRQFFLRWKLRPPYSTSDP